VVGAASAVETKAAATSEREATMVNMLKKKTKRVCVGDGLGWEFEVHTCAVPVYIRSLLPVSVHGAMGPPATGHYAGRRRSVDAVEVCGRIAIDLAISIFLAKQKPISGDPEL